MSFTNNLIGPFGKYEPTGSFSFEFFARDPETKELKKPHLFESFFLLPPEEYSMSEGYKMTVTKTIGGAWVDDFGNDLKEITLSGSLYSYYFGTPNVAGSGFAGDLAAEAKNTWNNATKSVPLLGSGIAGIDEFFKLRHIVNRFRDNHGKLPGDAFQTFPTNLQKKFPELIFQNNDPGTLGDMTLRMTWDYFGCIYHDYDDGNHYEVVFNDFKASRNKSDPFTVNYTINMTCLREVKGDLKMFGSLGRGAKETYKQMLNDVSNTWDDLLEEAANIATVPLGFVDSFNNTISTAQSLANSFEQLKTDVRSDWESTLAEARSTLSTIQSSKTALIASDVNETDLENDDDNLSDDILEVYNMYVKMETQLYAFSGIEKYAGNIEKVEVFESTESSLYEKDIPIEATENDDNSVTENLFSYYIVKDSDTLSKIAHLFYGDYKKANIIGEVNNLINSDFDNNALMGETIKIPVLGNYRLSSIDNNLVYTKITGRSTTINRQMQVLGTDLRLNNNRDFVSDGINDLGILYAEDCYAANIQDRMSHRRGVLWELHPDWGISADIGDAPMPFFILKALDDIEFQAQSDPRTQYAYVNRDQLKIEGDKMKVILVTKPLTGSENIIDVDPITF